MSRLGPITHRHTAKGGVTPTYASWANMRNRCSNERDPNYKQYGARGISVCDRWNNGDEELSTFQCFLADMGEKPKGLTLERIDVDGDYHPDNCKWATWIDQANNRTNNVRVECWGITRTVSEWSQITGLNRETINYCLTHGRPVEEALSAKPRKYVRLSPAIIANICHLAPFTPRRVLAELFGLPEQRIREVLQPHYAGPAMLAAAGGVQC